MLQGYKDHLIWRGSKLPWEQGSPIYQTSATPILKCNGHSHQPPIVWLNRLNKQKHGLHWKSNSLLFLASVASMCSLIITEKSLLSFHTNAWYWRLLWQKHVQKCRLVEAFQDSPIDRIHQKLLWSLGSATHFATPNRSGMKKCRSFDETSGINWYQSI